MASFPLSAIEGGVGSFTQFQEYTASDTFVVPVGTFAVYLKVQAGGSNGGPGTNANSSGGGGSAGSYVEGILQTKGGETLTLTVGASGGVSEVEVDGVVRVSAPAGNSGTTTITGGFGNLVGLSLVGGLIAEGGRGGNGNDTGNGAVGFGPLVFTIGSSVNEMNIAGTVSSGGIADSGRGGGGGGGSSFYGAGGDGGAGNSSGTGFPGLNAPATSYGAGGGGAGEGNSSNGAAGNGAAGIIQLWY